MADVKHTPTPWLLSAAGPTVYALHGNPPRNRFSALVQAGRRDDASEAECIANARRIVQCVNTHDELVAALRGMLDAVDDGSDEPTLIAARAAVAKATGSAE